MLKLNGSFLLKLYTLVYMYELYTTQFLSTSVEGGRLNVGFRMKWFEHAISVIKSLDLFEFSTYVFSLYTHVTRHNVYQNKCRRRRQIFGYDLGRDRREKFRIDKFRKFLNDTTSIYDSSGMAQFRTEILRILNDVENVISARPGCQRDIIISFSDFKNYHRLFEQLAIQWKFTRTDDNDFQVCIFNEGDSDLEITIYKY